MPPLYPREFGDTARARVELEILKGRRQLQEELNNARGFPSRVTLGPSAERAFDRYVLRVFLTFAEQACDLSQNGIWSVSRVRTASEEFLRLFTIQAFYEDGIDADGRRLTSDPISHYTGEVLSEAMRRFRGRGEWIQFEELLVNLNTSKALPFRWEDLDQRLLSPKLERLAIEMHKRIADAERRIDSEVARSGNTAGYLSRLFDFHEQLTDEWANRTYTACCEACEQQNRPITPAFIRAVRDEAIVPLIATRNSTVLWQVDLRGTRTRQKPNAGALGAWRRKMGSLAARWCNDLEAKAVATEYRAVGQQQESPKQSAAVASPSSQATRGNAKRAAGTAPTPYRSKLKRLIAIQLGQNPGATDLEICRALDADGGLELPMGWKSNSQNRLFADAYLDAGRRNKIQVAISKIRRDLRRLRVVPSR
jgi:hypothetical protein